jgi:hypothetical protein
LFKESIGIIKVKIQSRHSKNVTHSMVSICHLDLVLENQSEWDMCFQLGCSCFSLIKLILFQIHFQFIVHICFSKYFIYYLIWWYVYR